MNTRSTFNGKRPKKHTLSTVMLFALVAVLASSIVAVSFYIVSGEERSGRYAVKGDDFRNVQPMPSDLHQGRIDDGGYK